MSTRVRFIERDGKLSVLEIESSPDHPLLRRLIDTLRDLGVRVVERERRMLHDRSVERVIVSEMDGGGISESRRFQIQSALVTSASQPPLPSREGDTKD